MKQMVMLVILISFSGAALADLQETNGTRQSACEVTRLYSWSFETGPEGWGGWGYCHEDNLVGPDSARSDDYCRGTECDGYYEEYSTYSLVSGNIVLPPLKLGQSIYLSFWHWHDIIAFPQSDGYSWATIQTSIDGISWDTLRQFKGSNTDWSYDIEDLSAYSGESIKIKFELSTNSDNTNRAWGWYIDDIGIELHTFGVDAGADMTICLGECVSIEALAGCGVWPYSYSWLPSDGLSDSTVQDPLACPEQTTTYVVTVTDDSLNTATDMVVVTVVPTDVPLDENPLPGQFVLQQNYPNPFNPITEISFSLPRTVNVKLEIYNIRGQKVATVADKRFKAGIHAIEWEASQVASGVYFYRLDAGDYSATRKMMLLK